MAVRQLFAAQSVNTTTAPVQLRGSYQGSVHVATFLLSGTPAGAKAALEVGAGSAGPFVAVTDSTLEAAGAVNVEVANGYYLRAVLANSSTVGTSCDGFFSGGVYTR